ncbi:MAG: ABC transporter permease [Ignavibacteriota bacterium]
MTNLLRDFRFAFRLLWQHKGFTAIAVLALALGVGPNTAIFSVIYATLYAPMPYPHAEQMVMVWSKIQGNRNGISAGDFLDWQKQSTSFQGMWAWSGFDANLGGTEGPEQVPGTQSTPGQLSGLGVPPIIGRDFRPDEDQPGRDHVVVFSNRLWQRRFGGKRDIVGQTIRMNGEPYTVVGIMPPGQMDRLPNQLWVPLSIKPDQINHDFHWLLAMARLKPGVSVQQAQADMDAVTKHIADVYPPNKGWGASVEPLRNDFLPKEEIQGLYFLMGGVAFVLLIACANVTNLLLARGTAREREIAIRASIGAGRARLFRQMISEGLLLALIGGVAGIGIGYGILKLFTYYMPPDTLPSEADVSLNIPVLLFTLAATLIAGVLAGSAPAFQAARLNLNAVLKQSGRSIGFGKHFLRRALVVAEFALALTLLAGAGLAIHSFLKITQLDLGVRTDHILTFYLPVPQGRLTDPDKIRGFYRDILARMSAVPAVRDVTATTGMPLQGTGFGMPFNIVGRPQVDGAARPNTGFQMVTPGYFRTFGIRTVRGREIDDRDLPGAPRVAMVDETFVRRYMKDVDPLKQRILIEELIPGVTKLGPPVEWEIVGVFHTVVNGSRPGDFPVVYVPFSQSPWPTANLAVRTAGDPGAMTKSIGAAIRSLDPDLPMAGTATMDQVLSDSHAGDRFSTVLIGSFAAVALLLAVLGIYGVMAFLVAQRTHEIGLRIALGAGRLDVLRMVLGEGLQLSAMGLAAGLAGAYLVGRAMHSMLYGVPTLDLAAFGAGGGAPPPLCAAGLLRAGTARGVGGSHDCAAGRLSVAYFMGGGRAHPPQFAVSLDLTVALRRTERRVLHGRRTHPPSTPLPELRGVRRSHGRAAED